MASTASTSHHRKSKKKNNKGLEYQTLMQDSPFAYRDIRLLQHPEWAKETTTQALIPAGAEGEIKRQRKEMMPTLGQALETPELDTVQLSTKGIEAANPADSGDVAVIELPSGEELEFDNSQEIESPSPGNQPSWGEIMDKAEERTTVESHAMEEKPSSVNGEGHSKFEMAAESHAMEEKPSSVNGEEHSKFKIAAESHAMEEKPSSVNGEEHSKLRVVVKSCAMEEKPSSVTEERGGDLGAAMRCPVTGCREVTRKMKEHCLKRHINVHLREKRKQLDPKMMRLALEKLARWILGPRGTIAGLLDKFNQDGVPLLPKTARVNADNIRMMSVLCVEMRWKEPPHLPFIP
ncbi:uncharacterized protein [Ptychodera flava]|uniref:uncharacterized protein n=1 Tax=Ptychodera flava TaxID=63121 RepID=UPI00396A22C8